MYSLSKKKIIEATVVYTGVENKKNKAGLQIKTAGHKSIIRGLERNKKTIEVQQKQTPKYMEMNYLITTAIFLTIYRIGGLTQ